MYMACQSLQGRKSPKGPVHFLPPLPLQASMCGCPRVAACTHCLCGIVQQSDRAVLQCLLDNPAAYRLSSFKAKPSVRGLCLPAVQQGPLCLTQ